MFCPQHVSELMEDMALEHAELGLGRPSQSHGGQSFVLDRFCIGSDSGAPSVGIFEGDAHVADVGLPPDELDLGTDQLPLMGDLFDSAFHRGTAIEESNRDLGGASSLWHPCLRFVDGHCHPSAPFGNTLVPSGGCGDILDEIRGAEVSLFETHNSFPLLSEIALRKLRPVSKRKFWLLRTVRSELQRGRITKKSGARNF